MTALLNPFWYALTSDPYFASVVLLCHFDGTNGSTTVTDSTGKHGLAATGNSLTTSQQMFGTASLSNTAANTYVVAADSADWLFAAGQFTVEAFIRPTSAISGVRAVMAQFGGSTDLGWFFGFSGNNLNFYYSTTGTDNPVVSGAYTPTLNSWVHVAADRDASNVLRVYAGGAVMASATVSATFFNSTRSLRIANDDGGARGFIGQIDELRITKGAARYAGAFTPPSAPFPDF